MYKVITGEDVFYFKTFAEIEPFFNEVLFADGAEDAEIRVSLVDLDPALL